MDDSGRLLHVILCCRSPPAWHGRNLDALWDSLTSGDINQRYPPFQNPNHWDGADVVRRREMVRRFEALVLDAEREGHGVRIELLP